MQIFSEFSLLFGKLGLCEVEHASSSLDAQVDEVEDKEKDEGGTTTASCKQVEEN